MKRLAAFLRRRTDRRGFSLIDVLIGVVVLSIALASAFSLSIHNARLMERNQQLSSAALLARYKLEELRNVDYAGVVSGADENLLTSQGDEGGIFTRSWTVATNTPAPNTKTITVVVSWEQWGQENNYTMRGVVSDD